MTHGSRRAGDCADGALDAAFPAEALGGGKPHDLHGERAPHGEYVRLHRRGGLHVELRKVPHLARVHLGIPSDDVVPLETPITPLRAPAKAPTARRSSDIHATRHDFSVPANEGSDA